MAREERDTLIIGLGYERQQGKDLAARIIIDANQHFYDVRRYSIAAPLKRSLNVMYNELGGWEAVLASMRKAFRVPDWVQLEEEPIMDDPESPYGKQRKLLQWYGTDVIRKQHPDHWVNLAMEDIQRDNPQVALVTDLRFPNETEPCDFTLRVIRLGFDNGNDTHVSETQMRDHAFDYTLSYEDGDLDGLRRSALFIFDDCILRHLSSLRYTHRKSFEDMVRQIEEGKRVIQ